MGVRFDAGAGSTVPMPTCRECIYERLLPSRCSLRRWRPSTSDGRDSRSDYLALFWCTGLPCGTIAQGNGRNRVRLRAVGRQHRVLAGRCRRCPWCARLGLLAVRPQPLTPATPLEHARVRLPLGMSWEPRRCLALSASSPWRAALLPHRALRQVPDVPSNAPQLRCVCTRQDPADDRRHHPQRT
jgi:hypothetical protein